MRRLSSSFRIAATALGGCAVLLVGLCITSCTGKPEQEIGETPEPVVQPEVTSLTAPTKESVPDTEKPIVEEPTTAPTLPSDAPRSSPLPLKETSTTRYMLDVAEDLSHLDPRKDGWVGELINDATSRQLAQLVSWFEGNQDAPLDPDGKLLAPEFSCSALHPAAMDEVFRDEQMVVRRSVKQSETSSSVFEQADGLQQALQEMLASFGSDEGTSVDVALKVIGVEPGEQLSTTRVLVELNAAGPLGRLQQNATWSCQWIPAPVRGDLPLLSHIKVIDFEEVLLQTGMEPLFTDITTAVLGDDPTFNAQLNKSIDHWRERLDWRFTQVVTGPHGLAVGDVNGDGLEDLFYCETGGLPNRLYLQQNDGTMRDRSAAAQIDYLEPASSALLVDLDNDGDADLVLSSGRNLLFLENNGSAQFQRRRIMQTGSVARSMTAIDFDLDGLLDIYVCGYFGQSIDQVGIGRPLPYHDANNGVRNYLLDNIGSWDFADVTEAVGLESNNRRFSYAAAWEDYDLDGDMDLYVANDFGRNNLYRNDGGRFTDVAADAGVEDISAGMSVSWGDYNRDGLPDLYVGNMFSAAGNRVAYQRQYRAGDQEGTLSQFQRHARGNSLFANQGDGTFRDVSEETGVTMGRWAWGSNFIDVNNDGWEDIVVANGLVTNVEDSGDL